MTNECVNCKKSFFVKPYRKDIAKYCSYSCYWGKSTDLSEKNCGKCGQTLSIQCFGKKNRGWESHCKECRKKEFRNWSRKNVPTQRLRFYEWSSKKRGLEFNISLGQFESLTSGACFYCGGVEERLGLDRVDSSIGYIIDNVVGCCRRCNVAKNDMPQADFISMCKRIAQRHV